MATPIHPTRKSVNRSRRWFGRVVIGGIWSVLLALIGIFGTSFLIYRDLKAPERSSMVDGTRLEDLARRIFETHFCPAWQEDSACAQFDPELVYIPKPGAARFAGIEFDTRITMTPDGLRQQPRPGPTGQTAPIVITGDSYAMGWGVNDAETYSALLEQRYRNPTVNAGVSSYGTARELKRLQSVGLLARARAVVVQYCPNDAAENSSFLARSDGRINSRDPRAAWSAIQGHQARSTADVSYRRVLGALLGVLKGAVEAGFLGRGEAERPPGGLSAAPEAPRQSSPAEDFLAVIDRFPELATKQVVMIELKPFSESSGFLPDLARIASGRPNLHVLPLTLDREDYFRFDSHLRVRGHGNVAAQLDRALRSLR